MNRLSKEEYLIKCKELLDHFGIDYSGDVIMLNSGHLSVIMNIKSVFYELFGGHSIWSVAQFVADEMGKKIEFENEYY